MPKQNFSRGARHNWKIMFHIYTEQCGSYSIAEAFVSVIFVSVVGAKYTLYYSLLLYPIWILLILWSSQVSTLVLRLKVMFMETQKFRNKRGLSFHLYYFSIQQMRTNITMTFFSKIIKLTANIVRIRIQVSLQVELLIFLIIFLAQ